MASDWEMVCFLIRLFHGYWLIALIVAGLAACCLAACCLAACCLAACSLVACCLGLYFYQSLQAGFLFGFALFGFVDLFRWC
jgi:uncharacterized membrane protein